MKGKGDMLFSKKGKESRMHQQIESVFDVLDEVDPTKEEYKIAVENLGRLYEAKNKEKRSGVSPDTVAIVVGNLIGIALILWHEKAEVITTKALGFVIKGRV